MQIDTQTFLDLVEATGKLCFLDIEASGLKGDYNSILCASFKPFGKKPYTLVVDRVGADRKLAREIRDEIEKYLMIVTYYGTGFDVPMIQTRLLNARQRELAPIYHADLYFKLKYKLLLARRSQAHILRMLGTKEQKMDMSPEEWNLVLADPVKNLPRMIRRCESDVAGLEGLYRKTRHLIKEVKRG